MTYGRVGSRGITALSGHGLWVRGLLGARLEDRVVMSRKDGALLEGKVVELSDRGARVLFSQSLIGLNKDHLTLWLTSKPLGDEEFRSRLRREPKRWYSSIPGWDALYPTYLGDRVLLKTPDQEVSLQWALMLAGQALAQGARPVYLGLNGSPASQRMIRRLWADKGLDEGDLFLSLGTTTSFNSLGLLQEALAAVLEERGSEPVCFILRDLDSWFQVYREQETLEGRERSLPAMVNAFHGHVNGFLDRFWARGSQVTLFVLLSDWQRRGCPSPLWGLRGYFDLALTVFKDRAIGLEGDVSTPGGDLARREATLLRRQFKALQSRIFGLLARGEAVPDSLADFRFELGRFLSGSGGEEKEPAAALASAWALLSNLDEGVLDRIPLALLREKKARLFRGGES